MVEVIEDTVCRALSAVLGRPVGPDDSVERANEDRWDSLKHLELLFAIEDELGFRFGKEEMADLDSLEKIIESTRRHHAS